MLASFLTQYGFTEKQAKVYLGCLELGSATTSTIARFCHENRLTTYSVLRELVKKKHVQEIVKNKIKYYVAFPPDALLSEQEQRYKQLQEKLPELMALVNTIANKPKMQFYEGFAGLKKMYEDFWTTDVDFKAFIGTDPIDQAFDDRVQQVRWPKRITFPVKTYVIGTKGKETYPNLMYRQHYSCIIDAPDFKIPNEIVMYAHTKVGIAMYTPKEMFGIIIDSQTLHDTMMSLFTVIWNAYQKYDKKK